MRYLVIGLGNIGAKRKTLLGDRCVGTVDSIHCSADYSRIEQVPTESFDVAVLAVPNSAKVELLSRLLSEGKHVLVEKPLLFPSQEVAETLQNLSAGTGCVWYTSYNHRFEPLIVRLKELLRQSAVGSIYHARMMYGNGTVQNSLGSWRESGYGVLEDLGCHLIDLTRFLFGYESTDFKLWEASKIESAVLDHCIFATVDRKVVLECATTIWKNSFTIDIYGKSGSLHLNGLCKWGPSELLIHERVFPSGRPIETKEVVKQDDLSWISDFEQFEECVRSGRTSFTNDLAISEALIALGKMP